MEKIGELYYRKIKHDIEKKDEDLYFIIWKAELNKELLSFWKSISK